MRAFNDARGDGRLAVPPAFEIDADGPHLVPIADLADSDSPRLDGVNIEHAQGLADSTAELPPILVHRPTMRVIDGMHRLCAAILRGRRTIAVRFFSGSEKDAFVLAVHANVAHGLPLSLADRTASAERVMGSHPEWSDRATATVTGLSRSWSRLNLGTRLLTLLDVSGTMALPVPGTGLTRMRAITRIATEGIKLFPVKSEIGVWEFSTNLDGRGVDYRETVPVGPLTENLDGVLRRDLINRRLAATRARATGDTGLNDTLAAAYRRMNEEYQGDKINTVVVLTDGAGNDDPEGGIGDREILRRLKREYDPERPVSILIIAFGPDAPKGRRQMEALARATGGEAYIAKDIGQVRTFFLEGMRRRLCAPHC
ncbi:VWA domain-containing protein [Streptosporangium algeriense]|uniref:VWA domain-containing protein n=1 Tax=Streptosporangium algeriense TaxID=1682748 RepID=A0ABW3DJP9_9ACTN